MVIHFIIDVTLKPNLYHFSAQMMNAAAQVQNQGDYYPMIAPPYWMQHMYAQQMMAARGIIPPVFMYPPGNL